jgi:hypothetical protein
MSTIEILDYEANCDCINVTFSNMKIAPFHKMKVYIKFVPYEIGYFNRLVVLTTNATNIHWFTYFSGISSKQP